MFGDFLSKASSWREENPGVLSMIGAGMMNGNLGEGFANAAKLQQVSGQRRKIVKALMDRGLAKTPEEALLFAENPSLIKTLNPELAAGDVTFGTTPQWYKRDDGTYGYGVQGSDGSFKDVDTGGRELLGPEGIGMARARGTALGKYQGEGLAALPKDLARATNTVKEIDQLIANPGLDEVVGVTDQFRPSWTMSGSGRDALARYKQLQGRSFLEAYSILRGGGQITEVEGNKAQDAMVRMDRAQDENTFKTALKDFRDAVEEGTRKLQEAAGVTDVQDVIPPAATDQVPAANDYKGRYGLE
jgi:hypothetical protein